MTELRPNPDESIRFLATLWPTDVWVLCAISVDKKRIESRAFVHEPTDGDPSDDARSTRVRDWLALHRDRNVYYSVNVPAPSAYEKKKLSKSDVLRVRALHVDVDPRAGEDVATEQDRILRLITSYKTRPSALVFSGGGYNALWVLDEPVPVAEGARASSGADVDVDEAVRRATDVERRNWQFELDFDTPDHCRDVSRILRLPGTINRPNAEKIAKGRVPSLASIVWLDPSTTYPLSAFQATPVVADNRGSRNSGARVSGDVTRVESVDALPRDVADTYRVMIVQGFDPDREYASDRSTTLFSVVCELVRAGVDDPTIMGIITDSRFGISASVLDKRDPTQYAARQISRARDKAFHPKLAEMNEQYAVIANFGGRCVVMREEDAGSGTVGVGGVFGVREPEFVKKTEHFSARDHEKITWVDPETGKKKVRGVGSWWFDQRRRRQYEHVVFEPGLDSPGDFNLWRGFAVQPMAGTRHESFLSHMRDNICDGVSANYDYLIRWMARVVQQPRTQSMVAPVLLGERGTGKSVFGRIFASLFGPHAYVASDVLEITGKFNAHLRTAVFVLAEEAFDLRDKRHESVLKERITGLTMAVERKGFDIEQARNFIHMMLISNNARVVPAGDHERRFFVIRVGSARMRASEYFLRILADQRDGGASNLLYHLMNLDLSGFDVTRPPETQELRDQQEHNLSVELDWLATKLESGTWFDGSSNSSSSSGSVLWTGPIGKTALYEDYLAHCARVGLNRAMGGRAFGKWLRDQLPGTSERQAAPTRANDHTRVMTWLFPPLRRCREEWLSARGWSSHDWPEETVVAPLGLEPPAATDPAKGTFS